MGTVKFALLSWFSIVRDVWRQQFSVLSKKTNNISVVSSHFHLYLRISALRLPTVRLCPTETIKRLEQHRIFDRFMRVSLRCRHNERHGDSNYQPFHCLVNCLFRRRSKKISKLRATDLWAGNSPVIGQFPTLVASNTVNVFTWWRLHVHNSPKLLQLWNVLYMVSSYVPVYHNRRGTTHSMMYILVFTFFMKTICFRTLGPKCKIWNLKHSRLAFVGKSKEGIYLEQT